MSRHLAKSMHDVTLRITEVWCEQPGWSRDGASESIGLADCPECLKAAADYGKEAAARYIDLWSKPKA